MNGALPEPGWAWLETIGAAGVVWLLAFLASIVTPTILRETTRFEAVKAYIAGSHSGQHLVV